MGEKRTLNPMAMSAEEAAKTLGIPREWVEEDLAAGAPTNPACEQCEKTGRVP